MSSSLETGTTPAAREPSDAALMQQIADLARGCSIEISERDLAQLEPSRALLPAATRIYVSFLPKQTWQQTHDLCRVLRAAGLEPVPHVPVRLIADATALERIIAGLVEAAQVRELLLIAGDYPQPAGAYAAVAEVLRTGVLSRHGIRRVSVAGHPEGHPRVPLDVIRAAEIDKAHIAADSGLELRFVTQFFFEAEPFLQWQQGLRAAAGPAPRIAAGLVGPTALATLMRYAVRCGAGPSIRALSARPNALMKLLVEHGPETVMRALARARLADGARFDGLHFFCFGGYLRTCQWLWRVANGQFALNDDGGFDVFRG